MFGSRGCEMEVGDENEAERSWVEVRSGSRMNGRQEIGCWTFGMVSGWIMLNFRLIRRRAREGCGIVMDDFGIGGGCCVGG